MDRRSFLKIGALAASSGVVGACGQVSQKVIPAIIPADDGVNPVDGHWYATTCRECLAGCGVIVRTVNGRAKKVEGNPIHPVSGGKACARAQGSVRSLYHADRLAKPKKLAGAKGSGKYADITWDEAIATLGEKLAGANGSVFYLNDGSNDAAAGIAKAVFGKSAGFMMAGNAEPAWATYFKAGSSITDFPSTPYPDMANANFTILLGADVFESDRSPVYFARQYGQSRRGRPSARGRFVYIGSRISATAASCDKWLPVPPGRLGFVALALAHVVVGEALERDLAPGIPRPVLAMWKETLKNYSPEDMAEEVELEESILRRMARPFIEDAPGAVVAGDDVAGYTNGAAAMNAVSMLNILSYEIGKAKLKIAPKTVSAQNQSLKTALIASLGVPLSENSFARLKSLTEGMSAGKFGVGIISHTNPVYDTPAGLKFKEALSKTPFVAYIGNFMDETAVEADLILPDHHWLESWSATTPDFEPGVAMLNLQQPVVTPYFETKAAADILIEAAKKGGMDTPGDNGDAYVKSLVTRFRSQFQGVPASADDNIVWTNLLQTGGWYPPTVKMHNVSAPAPEKLAALAGKIGVEEAAFDGGDSPFHLHVYQTVHLGRGKGANVDWFVEMPDPITTVMWGGWIEINPAVAQKMGIELGDLVTVTSPHGSVTAPAYPYAGLRPDVIAIPMGYGHSVYGKGIGRKWTDKTDESDKSDAIKRSANPMQLLGVAMDEKSGAFAWRSQKVGIKKAGGSVRMLLNGHPEGERKGEVFQL